MKRTTSVLFAVALMVGAAGLAGCGQNATTGQTNLKEVVSQPFQAPAFSVPAVQSTSPPANPTQPEPPREQEPRPEPEPQPEPAPTQPTEPTQPTAPTQPTNPTQPTSPTCPT